MVISPWPGSRENILPMLPKYGAYVLTLVFGLRTVPKKRYKIAENSISHARELFHRRNWDSSLFALKNRYLRDSISLFMPNFNNWRSIMFLLHVCLPRLCPCLRKTLKERPIAGASGINNQANSAVLTSMTKPLGLAWSYPRDLAHTKVSSPCCPSMVPTCWL